MSNKPDGWGQRLPGLPDGPVSSVVDADSEVLSGVSRRHFLQATGFGFIGTMMLGCSAVNAEEALPYLEQPEGVVAGRSDLYATTCGGCAAGCGMLARSRDGRPVKLEGNPDHPVSRGGLCAVGQASLLGLYDSHRLRGPMVDGKPGDWASVDQAMNDRLGSLRSGRARVRYLSTPITSPNKRVRIDEFLATFADSRLVQTSPVSHLPIAEAHGLTEKAEAMKVLDEASRGTRSSGSSSRRTSGSRRRRSVRRSRCVSATSDGFMR